MRVTITDLTPYEARCALQAQHLSSAVRDLDEMMRSTIKHDAEPCIPEDDDGAGLYNDTVHLATQHWRSRLHDLLDEYGIDLDDDEEAG